jgi:hypothetical protein
MHKNKNVALWSVSLITPWSITEKCDALILRLEQSEDSRTFTDIASKVNQTRIKENLMCFLGVRENVSV